jgi:hypothetical protein
MNEQVCRTCKETKPVSDYYVHKTNGLTKQCKACHNNECLAYRKTRDVAEFKKQQADYYQKNKARINEADRLKKRWRFRDRDAMRARYAVADALRRGKLVKPAMCEGCNTETPSRRLQAHHPNHLERLNVNWLCVDCHAKVHTGAGHWRSKKQTPPESRATA